MNEEIKPVEIQIITDGGPWAKHNFPCPVLRNRHAVLNLGTGTFHPSWKAQEDGWTLIQVRWKWLRCLLNEMFGEKI